MLTKQSLINKLFNTIAANYDLMNDIISFGIHRTLKRQAIALTKLDFIATAPRIIIDLAAGTGDLALLAAKFYPTTQQIIAIDPNTAMLQLAANRLSASGSAQFRLLQARAEQLPLAPNTADLVLIGFGLRNFGDPQIALQNIYKILQPNGKLVILEFAKPNNKLLRLLYGIYLFAVIPMLATLICRQFKSYWYLATSIWRYPGCIQIQQHIITAGFNSCSYYTYLGGSITIHYATKT